ncbi:MAG: hypothetical protein ACRC5Q_05625, partial [Culicoidibacterales bacterium]
MKRQSKKIWKIIAIVSLVLGQFASFGPVVLASEIENPTTPPQTSPLIGEEPTVALKSPGIEPLVEEPIVSVATEFMSVIIDQTFITTPQNLNLALTLSNGEDFTDVIGYYQGTNESYKDLNFTYNDSTSTFDTAVEITQYERNQTFELVVIYVTRVSDGQQLTFYNQDFNDWFFEGTAMDFSTAHFTYENPVTDITPPEVDLENMMAEPVVVGGNQTITITVPISDESPIVEAYINHEGEDKFSFLTPEFQLNQKSGVFEATILIEPFSKTQFFTTTQLVVGDVYGNYSMFADLEASEWTEGDRVELSSIDFQVSNPGEDLIPPIAYLTTVRIELDADNNPILLFNVSDVQSGVQFVSAVYQTTHELQEVSGIIIDGEAQILLPIDNYLRSQTFILQSITVVDNQNNRTD